MHESEQKEQVPQQPTQQVAAKSRVRSKPRPFGYFVTAKTPDGQVKQGAALDKAGLRSLLGSIEFENTSDVRVIRGYEMKVQAKRNFSIN